MYMKGDKGPLNQQQFTYAAYKEILSEGKLKASKCQECGALHLPPRAICPECFGENIQWVDMSGKGQLEAYTTINIGLSAMIDAGYDRNNPYCTGIVKLDEGPRISAQIVDVDTAHPEAIAIGTKLQAVFLERGEGDEVETILAFEPR
jgi:uncharacterized OB-fold protein